MDTLPGNTKRASSFPRETQDEERDLPPAKQPRLASKSPDLPRVTSDVQEDMEPPVVTVTSDLLPSYNTQSSHVSPKQPSGPASTPGRSRIEVVLNPSPYKPLPGQKIWYDGGLDGAGDELPGASSSSAGPGRIRPHGPGSSSTTTTTTTKITGKRSRGRPKGWKPGMPSTKTGLPTPSAYKHVDNDGNRVVPPPSASAGPSASQPTTKKRGRPPRAPSPTPRSVWESMAAPRYVPFLCEWAGCKAELQNIGTLRRHLRKVHTREGGGGVVPACRWAGCGGGGGGKEEEEETLKFERVCELDEHVDRKHLLPFVWFVGDGVRNDKLVIGPGRDREKEKEEVPAYLLGADGAQVTPWVRDQQVEDFATFKANRRRLKAILLQRDANAPSIVDEEEHA